MSAYSSDLNYLFNFNQAGKKAYYVDSLLYNYTENNTIFNNNLPLSDYFVAISSIGFSYTLSIDVDKYLREVGGLPTNQVVKTFLATNASASQKDSSCPVVQVDGKGVSAEDLIRTATFEGDPDTNDITVNIIENRDANTILATRRIILANLYNNIRIIGRSLLSGADYSSEAMLNRMKVATHTEFDRYLSEINSTISYSYLDAARLLLPDNESNLAAIADATTRAKVQGADRIRIQALRSIKALYGNKYAILREELRKNCRKSLELIANDLTISQSTNFLSAFANRAAMANGSFKHFYLLLRSTMSETFVINPDVHYESDRKIAVFMKKVLVDLFIKTCYPLIHYDFIDILLRKYTALGDFVNARFALLAKIMFTYFVVDNLVGSLDNVPIEISQDFTTNLYNYIVRNNKGDIYSNGSREDKIKAIVVELHELSNQVSKTNNNNTILADAIRENQLSLRTLTSNNEIMRRDVSKKALVFYIVVAMMTSLVVIYSVLMYFEMYDYALIFAACTGSLVIVYFIVVWIIALVRKN